MQLAAWRGPSSPREVLSLFTERLPRQDLAAAERARKQAEQEKEDLVEELASLAAGR